MNTRRIFGGRPAIRFRRTNLESSGSAAEDAEAMKARHERMGNFKAAMVALGEAVIHGNKTVAGEHANRLAEALRGHEKDVPHKNVSRIKEFRALYGEMKKRTAKLAADAGTGNLQKTSLSYGRVLEACASCHKR